MHVQQNHWTSSRRSVQQHLFFLLHNCCKSTRHLAQIHANITTNGYSQKNSFLVKLLSLYTVFNNFKHPHQLFDQVVCPKSTNLWNQIIKSHSLSGNSVKSIELFNDMERSLASPDAYTYNYVVNSCTKGGLLREGEQIHGKVLKCGLSSNVYVGTSLVDFYVKCGGEDAIKKSRNLFDEMPERNVVVWNSLIFGFFHCGDVDGARKLFNEMPMRNMVSWTTMISGCVQNGRCKEALTLFCDMRGEHVEFDEVTLLSVLSACAELGHLNLGKWIHAYIFECFTFRTKRVPIKVNNALIHMYASCGEINAALAVFKTMEQKNTVSWTSMITGFAKHGYGDEALSMFNRMVNNSDVKPDEITFLGVLCACSHSGLVDEGRYYFSCMSKIWGVEPNIEHFGCMVDLLSRAGLLDEARELVKSMPMKPNDAVWGALLGGCRIYKNAEVATDVADLLNEGLDPEKAAGYLVLLSNVYAAAKRWRDVIGVRQKIVDTKTRKAPGRSWIEMEGLIHEFLAGDRSHENVDLIYEVLDEITREARLQGYMPYFEDGVLNVGGESECEVDGLMGHLLS